MLFRPNLVYEIDNKTYFKKRTMRDSDSSYIPKLLSNSEIEFDENDDSQLQYVFRNIESDELKVRLTIIIH